MQFSTLFTTAILAATTLAAPTPNADNTSPALEARTSAYYKLLGGGGVPSDSGSITIGVTKAVNTPHFDSISQLVVDLPGPVKNYRCTVHARGPVQPVLQLLTSPDAASATWNIGPPTVVDTLTCVRNLL
jgi:hypothetical protein